MNIDCRFYIVISYYASLGIMPTLWSICLTNLFNLAYFLQIDYEKKRAMD